jgi:hypothetical protein
VESELFKDAVVAILIGCGEGGLWDGLSAKAKMVTLGIMSLQNSYQVTQALAITKLPKHQSKELVPASEVLDITVTRVFASQIIEVIPVEKCHQLSKNVFVLIHMRSVVLTAKIQNQIR